MQKHCKVKKQTKHKPSKHMQQKYAAYPVNTTKLLCEQKQNRAFPQKVSCKKPEFNKEITSGYCSF